MSSNLAETLQFDDICYSKVTLCHTEIYGTA